MIESDKDKGPHHGQAVAFAGTDLSRARAAMVMLHGRGATADDILTLAPELVEPEFAYVAPQASGNTWYPYSFLAPLSQNEPGLSSGLQVIADILDQLGQVELPRERVMLLGFSQGGCLALEFAARHAQKYGGVVGLSAGLVGPEGTAPDYPGSMHGTPVFLGCDDRDFHIPEQRVHETAAVFQKLGAEVNARLYPNMGHTINGDEITVVRQMMQDLLRHA